MNELYSASFDGNVIKYDIFKDEIVLAFDHKSIVISMAICPILVIFLIENNFFKLNNEERIITFSSDQYLRIWNTEGKDVKIYESYSKEEIITSIAFSPDGNFIYLGDLSGKCYKLLNNKVIFIFLIFYKGFFYFIFFTII